MFMTSIYYNLYLLNILADASFYSTFNILYYKLWIYCYRILFSNVYHFLKVKEKQSNHINKRKKNAHGIKVGF